MSNVYNAALEAFGVENQLIRLAQEMSRAAKAINESTGTLADKKESIAMELGRVVVVLEQIKIALPDVEKHRINNVERLARVLMSQ
jgi:hypothetical protein